MSTPPYPAYPTYQISSSAVHLITGRLGDDPVACATQHNTPMTIFSVKVTRRAGTDYHTTWYRIKTFGTLDDPNLHLAAMNILPTGDIPFSKVVESEVEAEVEVEELAVAG